VISEVTHYHSSIIDAERKKIAICAEVKTGRTTELIQARQNTYLFSADLLDTSNFRRPKTKKVN
jgi:hypothetical protein